MRRTVRAACSIAGRSARVRSDPWSEVPFFTLRFPYAAARRNESMRSLAGRLTYSATRYTDPARHASAITSSSMTSPLERDDLLEEQGSDGHHHEAEHDHLVAGGGVEERRHVARVDQRQRAGEEERKPDEHVGRHAAHRRQRLDLPSELLAVAHGVGDHVEQRRE